MPYNSINTNVGAMTAIATFNAINAEMAEVQVRQQLAVMAMRIANQQPSYLLQLFQ